MSAIVPIVLLPNAQSATSMEALPTFAEFDNPVLMELRTSSGSPMPQEKVSRVYLTSAEEPFVRRVITTKHPVFGTYIASLERPKAQDLHGALVLWSQFSLNDTPQDRISDCREWRRHYAKTFISYLGLNEEVPSFLQIKDIRGKVEPGLDEALSSLSGEDEFQVFLLRAPAGASSHQLLKMVPRLRDDLALWNMQIDPGRRIAPPIFQTSKTSFVETTTGHAP